MEAFECVRHQVVILFILVDFVLFVVRWNFYCCCLSYDCFEVIKLFL